MNHPIAIMSATAFTRLFSNIGLAPLYSVIIAKKTMSCGLNDTVIMLQNLSSSDSEDESVTFEFGSRKLLKSTAGAVGFCLSDTVRRNMMEMARSTASNNDPETSKQIQQLFKDESSSVLSSISSRFVNMQFGSMYYPRTDLLRICLAL